jgi:hypothetical protein
MRVQEGDVIKFGRVRFRVKQIVVDQADVKEEELGKSPNKRDATNPEIENQSMGPMGNDTMLVSES